MLTVERSDDTVGRADASHCTEEEPNVSDGTVPIEECRDSDLRDTLEHFVKTLGFVPNSLLTMQRVPAIAKAVVQLNDYQTSPLFDDREKAALDFARDAASIPNGVTDASYKELTRHWTDDEIVEILGVVRMFGVFNRWNDSMATPLEAEPIARAAALLDDAGWHVGKHTPSP